MNKSQLIDVVSQKNNISKKEARTIINTFLLCMADELVKGEKIQLMGLGAFTIKKRAARVGRNPRTKDMVRIPECNAVVFKASQELKEKVNQH